MSALDRIAGNAFAAAKAALDGGVRLVWATPNWPWEHVREVGPVTLVVHAHQGHDGPTVFGTFKLSVWIAMQGGVRLHYATLYAPSLDDAKVAAERLLASEIN